MSQSTHTDTWLKAAVVGSLWGASEIVLGSFLHNLKIPFSGNLLTAIGIILMIAGHRLWPERGLIIRAGLICAALKTLSPSANIFGPMLAITMQATLMETALFIGRSTWVGYLLGGGLAMSWNIAHRIVTSVIIYGGNLIEIYKRIIDYIIAQTAWQTDGYMKPVLLIAGMFFLTGMVAATAGIYISNAAKRRKDSEPDYTTPPQSRRDLSLHPRQARQSDNPQIRQPDNPTTRQPDDTATRQPNNPSPCHPFIPVSIILALIAGMVAISRLPLYAATVLLLLFLTVVWYNDARLIKRFAGKRGFWISMGIMLVLSGFLLGRNSNGAGFSMAGMQAGLEMMMRAIYVITGFGLISKELRRQSLTAWFESRHLKSLLMAINISFQTTPLLIESIPGKQAWKNPLNVLTGMIAGMEEALDHMRKSINDQPNQESAAPRTPEAVKAHKAEKNNGENPSFQHVFIITGTKGSGKTTALMQAVKDLQAEGIAVSGILAPELVENGERIGYYVEDIGSGQRMVLCRKDGGGYVFDPEAIAFGESVYKMGNFSQRRKDKKTQRRKGLFLLSSLRQALRLDENPSLPLGENPSLPLGENPSLRLGEKLQNNRQIFVIDELGPFELKGQGWATAMDHLLTHCQGPMIWVVRESLIPAILDRWPAHNHEMFYTSDTSHQLVVNKVRRFLKK